MKLNKLLLLDKTPTSSVTCLTDEQIIEKLLKIKEISKTNIIQPAATEPAQNIEQEVVVHKPETRPENNKSLKELKELAIVLRQKLDSLESEKNVMEVEFSQVIQY